MSTIRKTKVREAVADDIDLTEENSQPTPFRSTPPQSLSIDDIMWRVRAEVARRRNGHNKEATPALPNQVPSFEESLPTWKSTAARIPAKDKYTLPELLAFSDAEFIDVAYRAVLRRPPDENGFNHYLQLLRAGANTKIEILGILSSSEEGSAAAVR